MFMSCFWDSSLHPAYVFLIKKINFVQEKEFSFFCFIFVIDHILKCLLMMSALMLKECVLKFEIVLH